MSILQKSCHARLEQTVDKELVLETEKERPIDATGIDGMTTSQLRDQFIGAFVVIGVVIVVGARVHQFVYRPELTEAQTLRAYGHWFALGVGIACGAIAAPVHRFVLRFWGLGLFRTIYSLVIDVADAVVYTTGVARMKPKPKETNMARKITCYVYDKESIKYVTEYLVTLGTMEGYTKPTVADMDDLQERLESKCHKTELALRRMANSSPCDISVDVVDRGPVEREEMREDLQEQADQYDADSVRHLRRYLRHLR
jgi:hypothetical protein